MEVFSVGTKNRKTGSTKSNEKSSRSHSVFSLSIFSTEEKDGIKKTKKGKINLVDPKDQRESQKQTQRMNP